MFSTLTHKPIIGIVSGITSWAIVTVQTFFTDETTLKLVGAFGVWAGALVAMLTVWLKVMEYREKRAIKKNRKKLRQLKYENLKQD
jgi:hypothetical protein